jgi:hypothetical protein
MNREVHVRFWESAGLRCPAPLDSKAFGATWGEHFEKPTHDDPTIAIQQARNVESQALSEYMRVLRVFADFFVPRQTGSRRCWRKHETIVPRVAPGRLWTRHSVTVHVGHSRMEAVSE